MKTAHQLNLYKLMSQFVNNSFFRLSLLEKKEWQGLIVIMMVSSALRLHSNFSTEYMPGNNGAFYLVMLRGLLEKGTLVIKDFPLLFWLEAGIAFIPYKLGLAGMNASIDMTSRIFDSIVPVLSIIPAYLLVKKILLNKKEFTTAIVFASISILYFSFLVLISDFQKNSLGLLWLFWLVYYLHSVHEKPITKNYLFMFLFLVLAGLTHYGCFAVAITVVVLDILVNYSLRLNLKKFIKAFIVSITIAAVCIGLVFLINKWRAEIFIRIPLDIFNDPILFPLLKGKPVLSPFEIFNMVLVNISAVVGFAVYINNYRVIENPLRSFILSMILLSLFLSSPMLNVDAALRVYFISYLTALPLIPFIYNFISSKRKKGIYIFLVVSVIILSIISVESKKQQSNMNENIYSEMTEIQKHLPDNSRTVIVARHGMEFWSMWIFRIDAVRQELLTKSYWNWYKSVIFLIQKKETSQFGPAGLYGPQYPQPTVPPQCFLIYRSAFFDLYKSPSPPDDMSIFQ